MQSILTVTSAATNRNLIAVDQVKSESGITDTASDEQIETLRRRASQALVGYCARQFARDEVSEVFRRVYEDVLVLGNGFPDPSRTANFCTITSVTIDGTDLTSDDYEIDPTSGLFYRLRSDCRTFWCGEKITIVYSAGYVLPDDSGSTLPEEVQGAALELIKTARFTAQRDPSLRSENILSGLYSYALFDPRNAESSWPVTVTDPMDKYSNPVSG